MRQRTRRQFLNESMAAVVGATLSTSLASLAGTAPSGATKRNVLFIAVDDLKPTLGCYGDPLAKSPNIDRLAAMGLTFTRAYCQQALCSPSRTSLMTGLRPDTTRIYDLETHFRTTIPNVVTLPEQFKKHGYHTQAFSKIYHGGLDDAQSWTVPHWAPRMPQYATREGVELMSRLRKEAVAAGKDLRQRQNQPRGLPWEAPDVPDNTLADGATADKAVEVLRDVKDRPFFLAVGFLKPHLPFVAPKKYWDMYDRNAFSLADNPNPPTDAPQIALTNWGELRAYYGMPKSGPLTEDQARAMLHGYYAAASYTDAQIGRVVAELDGLGLRDNTVVIVWGDHGWHLGDHGFWCKHTNYEQAVRSPLIISGPGQKSAGRKCSALVEFVDIAPSLFDLCGVPFSKGLEGTSFKLLIENPQRPWKKAALSQYPRSIRGKGRVMGHSLRTDRYRYTHWRALQGDFLERELYDYAKDPGEAENIVNRSENAELVKQLAKLLDDGWRAALPPSA